ncbi:MAG: hypothetical protein ACI4GX_04950 [Ruminococcus sp.]
MVRGDTLRLSVGSIKTADGEDYVLSDTDVIFLDVKKSAADKTAVFSKTATAANYVDGVLPFTIYPEDTAGLSPGDYFFDVRLFMDEDNIYTIIPMSKLKIVRNVTDVPEGGG